MTFVRRRLPRLASIPLLRPLRPPNKIQPAPRPFTQNSQLLLVAQRSPRPQLPYLAQPSSFRSPQGHRLISTETRAYARELTVQSVKWTAIIFVFTVLGTIAWTGVQMEKDERKNPTPSEWRFLTRNYLRNARRHLNAVEEMRSPVLDWAAVGSLARLVVRRLEDPAYEGKGLVAQGSGDGSNEALSTPEVGEAGYDIDSKSYEWKTGYFDALMLCATAAEHLENMVRDTKRNKIFPRDVMIGPSNPDPRPTPVYMSAAPREEDCERFFAEPETYYMKILTTKGFTTRQRIDAAEGYANWLEYKGLHESAEEMYRWAIDIAKSGLPNPAAADSVLDPQSNVLKADGSSQNVTSNLLRATTAMATHHARTGNTAAALPILLSVLRARRAAPLGRITSGYEEGPPGPSTDIGAAFAMIKSWISPAPFPPAPPSEDFPYERQSEKPTCEEGELMVYIGEILFASDRKRAVEGVGWTRQGVLIAEANLQTQGKVEKQDNTTGSEDKRCKECLLTGVQNWEKMLQQLTATQAASQQREGSRDASWLEWRGWFGSGDGIKGKTLDQLNAGMLEQELRQVGRLRERIVKEGIEQQLVKNTGGGLWLGFS